MKVIDKLQDLVKIFGVTTLSAPTKLHSLNYPHNDFKCGCSLKIHNVADATNSIFANASTSIFAVRFVIRCKNDFFTLVAIKGFFKVEAISEWTVSKKIFNESLEYLKLPNVDSAKLN